MNNVVRPRLLIVDNDIGIARAAARLLGPAADVSVEVIPERVLERLRDGERYDLILCDVEMPEMSGVDLFERVVQLVPAARDVFVFASGGMAPAMEERMRATGRPCLLKPVTGAEVLALLGSAPGTR